MPSATAGGPAAGRFGWSYRVRGDVRGKVQFFNCWDGPRTALVEAWIADLGAVCPGIKVENVLGDAGTLRDTLVTAIASGTPPNVAMMRSDWIPYFADQHGLLPLDDLMADDGIDQDWFTPSELASRRWNGRTYGLAQVTAGAEHLLYVNLDLLVRIGVNPARPIRTWQDLDALVEPARDANLLVLNPGRTEQGTTAHMLLTYANGGRYWDESLGQITWADEAGLEAAEWLVRFVKGQQGALQPPPASVPDGWSPLGTDEWGAGKQICCINGAGWSFDLHQQAQHLRYAVYDFPKNAQNDGSAGATPIMGGWTLTIPRASEDREAAWELVKLATASVSACAFTARQRRPSPLAGCDQAFGLANSQPFWPVVAASLSQGVLVPVSPIQPRLGQLYRQMQTDLLRQTQPARDVLDASAREAQRLLDEWNASRAGG